MMKKRKFGSGGMPSMKESMESGNRVSRQVGAETKKLMPATRSTRPSVGDAIASGNRMSKKNAEDLKAVKKYAKGGNVKRYADGDLAMSGAAVDLEAAARRGENLRELGRMNLSVPKIAAAKPKPKPAAAKPATSGMSDAEIRKFMSDNDRGADASARAAVKPAAAKPAARQEPRVGLHNLGNVLKSTRKFGESIGFRSAPRPEAAKPAAAKPAAAKPAAAKPAAAKPATRGMSDAQIRKFMSDNDKAANRSLDDTKIRKYMQGLNADADRSLAATKAKKEAKMASDIGKATTASLSAAASRAIPRTPGMPMRSGAGKPATSGMSDAEIRKFMRDNERGYEETAARKLANPISRTAKATGTAAKPRLVEPKYAKGGSVTRGDGIAKKGHTKGKIC
jgi:hypothetical protein